MTKQFTLTEKEFKKAEGLFKTLEIEADQVVGTNYKWLIEFLRKRYRNLILTYHPDKGRKPNSEKLQRIHEAYPILRGYIKSLECGKSDITVDIEHGDKRVTAREFHYGRKFFEESKMYEKDVVGKSYKELLFKFNSSMTRDVLERLKEVCKGTGHKFSCPVSNSHRKLYKYLFPHDIFFALEKSTDIIREDKVKLVSKIIEARDFWLHGIAQNPMMKHAFSVATYSVLAVASYLSSWVLPCYIINVAILYGVRRYYDAQYKNQKILVEEYISKVKHIYFYNEFVKYSLFALSVCLLTMDFISFGSTPENLYYSIFLGIGISIEIFLSSFGKGCEIYAEKYVKDLMEENPKDKVQKATDLLEWYDLRLPLILIFMPLVRMCFKDIAKEMAERNLDEVNTDLSDVSNKLPEQPKAIQYELQGTA
ncbi:DnaJ domain-containing protein [Wolbachia endosymbiont (group E) of Neria commutata]|uniref:DnaJ domain-containing protein n=1 Tax=Wolbachia endosymbiont (group E) of Neria commutata TaxID=3066149 RepID=UPI0031329C26